MKRITFIFVFALIVLAGCSSPFKKESAPTSDASAQKPGEKVVTCDMVKAQKFHDQCVNFTNEIAVRALGDEAKAYFDGGKCETLPERAVQGCKIEIERSGVKGPISEEARLALDTALKPSEDGKVSAEKCNSLTEDSLKTYCQNTVAEKMERDQLMAMYSAGKVENCDQFKVEQIKSMCNSMTKVKK